MGTNNPSILTNDTSSTCLCEVRSHPAKLATEHRQSLTRATKLSEDLPQRPRNIKLQNRQRINTTTLKMEQMKSMNALAPLLALTKTANSPRAAANLIEGATSAPNTFIFAELLQAPNIQALSNSPEYSNHLSLLKIFSYGTYTDYINTADLPTINAAQTLKLRQLSFLTLAKNQADLSYKKLLGSLGHFCHLCGVGVSDSRPVSPGRSRIVRLATA